MPKGQMFVANAIISKVVKSGARDVSFSIYLGQGKRGMMCSLLVKEPGTSLIFLYHDNNPTFVVFSCIFWVNLGLNPAHVGLNSRPFISDHFAIRLLMKLDTAGLIMLYLVGHHFFLVIIC